MTWLEKYHTLAQALGWTLLHSIWQISLVYVVASLAGRWLATRNAFRYYGCLGAMASCAVWSVLTFRSLYGSLSGIPGKYLPGAVPEALLPLVSPANASSSSPVVASGWLSVSVWLETHAALLGCLWGAGVLFFSLRLAGGWWLSHRLRQRSVPLADQRLAVLCRSLSTRLGIRRPVQILENQFIQAPLTLGFWKPVVLFPLGMVLQLQSAQVEVLLLHELAHIRRHDYLVNLFQMVLEVCFFYHPLFRLLAREAGLRREYACDDLVLRFGSDPWLYASILTEIKLQPVHPQPAWTMSAIGKSHFSTRIQRIMGFTPKNGDRSLPLFIFLLFLAGSAALCWPLSGRTLTNNESPASSSPAPAIDTVVPAPPASPSRTAVKSNLSPQSLPAVVVEMSNHHVLYIGLNNPLRILAAGVPADELIVKLVGPGKLQGQGVDYTVQVTTLGEVNIEVYRRQKNRESLLQSSVYQVKNIPDPTPLFAGLTSRKTTVDQLLLQPILSLKFDKVEFDVPCELVSYELTTLPKQQDPITHVVYSTTLPESLAAEISQLPPGSAIFLDDIRIKCPGDTEPRNVGGLAFKIAE